MKEISLNFGAIKDSILRLTSGEMVQENFKQGTLTKFNKALKESSILKKQYLVFNNFEKCKPFKKENLAERFIGQNTKLFEQDSWEKILSENKALRIELLGDSHVEASNRNGKLFESIHILIESSARKNFINIQKEQEAYDFVLSYLMRESTEPSKEEAENPELGWDYITKMAVSNFNERYEHLNEAEHELLRVLLSTPDKKINYLNDLNEENKKNISKLIKENRSDKNKTDILKSFQEKLGKLNLSEDKLDETIISLIELRESLEELSAKAV